MTKYKYEVVLTRRYTGEWQASNRTEAEKQLLNLYRTNGTAFNKFTEIDVTELSEIKE